ncbi:S1 family peptidase [Amycolatopsis nigrescens]|uniref:S1 family peptidase n=1 Tax=Amycolatopsis nigrescens TaxID=381445 RepID=UPI0003729438|nr:S1 family peptidase [Amycolatopsis nigrescens]
MRKHGKTLSLFAVAVLTPAVVLQPAGYASAADGPPAAVVDGLVRDLGLSPAQAGDRLAQQDAAQAAARELGASTGEGRWFDERTGKLAVAVTDQATADRVRAAGAEAVPVGRDRHELDRLTAAVAALAADGASGATGWGVHPESNSVLVRVVPAAGTERFLAGITALGQGVRVERADSAPVRQAGDARPGDPWWPGGESNCSIGFPATDSGGGKHFVTAGHCTNDADQPAYGQANQQNRLGTSNVDGQHSVNAREGDMGVVAVTEPGWELSASVNTWGGPAVTVAGATEPLVNQAVCHSGNTSKWQCGKVTAVNQTIDYGSVVIEGLSTTTACSLGGDSGGAWLAGDEAVGLHSGGQSSCSPGGADDQSIFQPVTEALSKWSLSLYTGASSVD